MTVCGTPPYGKVPMSVQMVLLPVFVQVGLTFALLLGMVFRRRNALVSGQTKIRDIALGEPNWPKGATQIANCYRNQFELPVLFYVLCLTLHVTNGVNYLTLALMWIFVASRYVHAWVHLTSNNLLLRNRSFVFGAVIILLGWIWVALHLLGVV